MRCGQLVRLKLGGPSTRFWLRGSLRTAVSLKTALRLAQELACWSGWPSSCVLSVDRELVCWCEWWADRLAGISARHLELCHRIGQPERCQGDR